MTHQPDEVPDAITHVIEIREGRALRAGEYPKS